MGNNKKLPPPEKPRDDAPEKATPESIEKDRAAAKEAAKDIKRPPLHQAVAELFEDYGVELAMATFKVPHSNDPPHVFYVGHFYDVAKLVSQVHRQFRDRIQEETGG